MKIDELYESALTYKNVTEFIGKRKFSIIGGAIAGTVIASTGLVSGFIAVKLMSMVSGGLSGFLIDKYLGSSSLEEKVKELDALVEKRKAIVFNIHRSGDFRTKYFDAVRPTLDQLRRDIKVHCRDLITAAIKSNKDIVEPEELERNKLFIESLNNILDYNKRNLKEAYFPMEVVGLAALALYELKNKLSRYKTYRDIKRIYKKHGDKDINEYFPLVEKLLIKYTQDATYDFYTNRMSRKDYDEQMIAVAATYKDRDLRKLM